MTHVSGRRCVELLGLFQEMKRTIVEMDLS
jgi:hypothetical protein